MFLQIIDTKGNVSSEFQMKVVTKAIVTKDSDRVREKLKLCGIWWMNCTLENVDCAGFIVQFQQKKVLVEPGEGYFNQQ